MIGWSFCFKICGYGVVKCSLFCRKKYKNFGGYKKLDWSSCKVFKLILLIKFCFKEVCGLEWILFKWGKVKREICFLW